MKTFSDVEMLKLPALKATVASVLALSCTAAQSAVFNIEGLFNFIGSSLTPSEQGGFISAFNQSASLWESLLTGYRSSMVPNGYSVTITATSPYIDGAGSVLGQAGPLTGSIYDGYVYTATGGMEFDSADVSWMLSHNVLDAVFAHEMAHVLGFGTLWDTGSWGGNFTGTQQVTDPSTGQYTGAYALAAWRSEFVGQSSAAFVPVELDGGPGTAYAHWNEAYGGSAATGVVRVSDGFDMRDELMTGWLNTSNIFISQTTVCSFRDIGYTTTGSCGILGPEPVPAPLPILGALSALAWSRKLRRRIRQASAGQTAAPG